MANWQSAKQYLLSNYKCSEVGTDALKLVFDLDDGRSQVVIVEPAGADAQSAAWLDFHSPIGDVSRIDLPKALARTNDFVLGGLSLRGDIVTLRATVPLENLDRNEIEEPLRMVTRVADKLEREFVGGDEY